MTQPAHISFRKMNGLGNDFVIIDNREGQVRLTPSLIHHIADRKEGIGCDQLILLETSTQGDVFMRIYNADGGEVDACGNATRCVAVLMVAENQRADSIIETNAGLLGAMMNDDMSVTIDMGTPRFDWQDIPLSEEFHDTRMIELQVGPIDDPVLHSPSVVNVGNPHCIFWVDDVEAHDLETIGPILEHHPLFPERANISLAHVTSDDALTLKVWERGTGLTQACGTAACAAAAASARKRLTGRDVTVTLPGGDLHIFWRTGAQVGTAGSAQQKSAQVGTADSAQQKSAQVGNADSAHKEFDDHILMTGPVVFEYEGQLDISDFVR